MKLLLFSENSEEAETLQKMILAYNSKLQIIHCSEIHETIDRASVDGPFASFIFDFDSPSDVNALALSLVDLSGARPLIFIGREAVLTHKVSQELMQSHANNETISKPISRERFTTDLGIAIQNVLEWAKQEEYESSIEEVDPSQFLPMKLRSLYLYDSFPHDLYLAITSKRYIKIVSAGKSYAHSTLQKYARKNVKYLFIKKDDQIKYLETETNKCLKALKNLRPTDKDIYLVLLRSTTILHQYILALGITESVLALTTLISESIINLYKNNLSLKPILKSYPMFYQGIASKSLLTAFICEAIAWKMGWESHTTKLKLAVCSLLQDITLPEETMSKANSLNSEYIFGHLPQDIDAYKNHPITAANFAKQFTSFPDIDYIIESHHELPSRKGFPNRPSSSKLTQICAVFNVAQYIAAEIDGEALTDVKLQSITRPITKIYNGGHFRDTVKIAISEVRIK